jgi:predicted  nucleic acid-binding Zn-ribbon protein
MVAVVTAAVQDQWRLLDVQAHDTRLSQLDHRRRTLPELSEVAQLQARLGELLSELVVARTAASDLARELAKAEADVEQVRARAARDRFRMDTGQGSAKDLQGLQHELETLAARQSVLEDAELDVMERQETATAALSSATAEHDQVSLQLAEAQRRMDAAVAALDAEAAAELKARVDAAAGLPESLLALYERVRESSGGVGAARLYQRRCEGCRLELPPNDLARIRDAAPDAVIRCEECSRILVRTADSGL